MAEKKTPARKNTREKHQERRNTTWMNRGVVKTYEDLEWLSKCLSCLLKVINYLNKLYIMLAKWLSKDLT